MYISVVVAGSIFMMQGSLAPYDLVAGFIVCDYPAGLGATHCRIYRAISAGGMTGIERFFEIIDVPVTIEDSGPAQPSFATFMEM